MQMAFLEEFIALAKNVLPLISATVNNTVSFYTQISSASVLTIPVTIFIFQKAEEETMNLFRLRQLLLEYI